MSAFESYNYETSKQLHSNLNFELSTHPPALVTPEVPTAVDGVAVVLAGAVVGAVAHTLARLPIEVGSPRTLLLADGNTPTGVWINPEERDKD